VREDSKRERERGEEEVLVIEDLDKIRMPVIRCDNSPVMCSCFYAKTCYWHKFVCASFLVICISRLIFKSRASYIYESGVPLPSKCCIIYIFF
jgi:hypothetical protein